MNQREVTDTEGTTWTCVQAYSAGTEEKAEAIAKRTEGNNKQIPVVCTPSGGAQSVRLQLALDWLKQLSDEDLLKQIKRAAEKEGNQKEA